MKILDVLEKIRTGFCVYNGTVCDCKFGGENTGQLTESGNGCPEIRVAIDMLKQAHGLVNIAEQMSSIAADWGMDEFEINGTTVSIYSLNSDFEDFLQLCEVL